MAVIKGNFRIRLAPIAAAVIVYVDVLPGFLTVNPLDETSIAFNPLCVFAPVNVCASPRVARVSVAVMFGMFNVCVVVCADDRVKVLAVVIPLRLNATIFVPSVASISVVVSAESFLFVNVCVAVKIATVPVELGNVIVLFAVDIKANVVVTPVVCPDKSTLSFLVASVPSINETESAVSDLFVNTSVPASVASVPVVGSVTFVTPVNVRVLANAPEVVKFPPSVIVFPLLFTPVPPYCPVTTVPCHTPVPIVPRVVIED